MDANTPDSDAVVTALARYGLTLGVATVAALGLIVASIALHELTHIAADYAADGVVGICPSSGLPIKVDVENAATFQIRTCVGGETLAGPGAVAAPLVGAAVGVLGVALSGRIRQTVARMAVFITGLATWASELLYLSGASVAPRVEGVALTHDAAVALRTYGPELYLVLVALWLVCGFVTFEYCRREWCRIGGTSDS